jgi:hypothetical protein
MGKPNNYIAFYITFYIFFMIVRPLHGLTKSGVRRSVPHVVGLDPFLVGPPPTNVDHLSFTSFKLTTTPNHIFPNRTLRKLRQDAITTLRRPATLTPILGTHFLVVIFLPASCSLY